MIENRTTAKVAARMVGRAEESGRESASAIEMPPRTPAQVRNGTLRIDMRVPDGKKTSGRLSAISPGAEHQCYGHRRKQVGIAAAAEHQNLQSYQHEEHGVQDLVDERPDRRHVFFRHVAHGIAAPPAAEEEARRDDRKRSAGIEQVRNRIGRRHERERDEDFRREIVDLLQGEIGDEAERQPERDAAARLAQEDHRDIRCLRHRRRNAMPCRERP